MKDNDRSVKTFPESRPMVFFDGGCPLCRREIAHYRRIDRAERLHWVDVTKEAGILSRYDLSLDSAQAQLHVLDEAGCWQRGIDAFLTIWDHLPAYRWLARVVPALGLRHPLGFAYRRFATWRYRRRCNGNRTPGKPATGA